jgi:hypothetical protein
VLFLLVLMGYYLLPERYLLAFHPHEHDAHCCSIQNNYEGDIISPLPQHCPEKENYKQIYDFQLKFFDGFKTPKETFCQVYVTEKIKAVCLFLSKPRAPPGLVDVLI